MKLVDVALIERLKQEERAAAENMLAASGTTFCGTHTTDARDRQDLWLSVYEKSGSISLACRRAQIPPSTYYRWRNTDWRFAERLNEAMSNWRDELVSSAVVRAIGYTVRDPDTGELVTDADGKVVRQGGSDSLARALLGLDKPVVSITENQVVVFEMVGIDDHDIIEQSPSVERALAHDHSADISAVVGLRPGDDPRAGGRREGISEARGDVSGGDPL